MRGRRTPRLEQIATIPELAAEAGTTVKTMRRRLIRLHERDGGDWLFRFGEREYAVNRSTLKAAHPHLFSQRLATQAEVGELHHKLREVEKRQNALASSVRAIKAFHEKAHAQLTRGRQVPSTDTEGQS